MSEPKLKPTEVTSLIQLTEGTVRKQLQPGVLLNIMPGAQECNVVTDPEMLGELLMNLLVNACKFTSKGAISFGYEIYDDELEFFVKDSGIGLTPEKKNRLEDLFDNDDTTSPGLGLGMPICNDIVKKLGGTIRVESRGPGRGTTFYFTIPYKESGAEASDEAGADDSNLYVNTKNPDRLTILVAEDNQSNYILFEAILKGQYNLARAMDGVEAVDLCRKINPDLILMDINMPNMDGYEAVQEIRKFNAEVPIIAVTAYAFVTDRQRILDNGFNGYVSKPINLSRLEREINACLNK